ncbi:regulator of nucleoside diphosphate kinase [Luteibacter sp. Sphag1AF]|uniref:nucleoside diphosphate kinase regulator n=1 Tax=Luteibacter sp. Sphag1AF TaxID=2587031 RepID=UPI001621AC43|nr:nucleoside diphosphate kinase regulator [Luteibacter sp. Sphag1AF]MBB3228249.1 regulator of nucleoside diphosphate kinase [Luteibacter sp. Sphag1AF]
MDKQPALIISDLDYGRIDALLENMSAADAARHDRLRQEIERATLVPTEDMPADVVTMNSTVTFEEVATGEKHTRTLVYPRTDGRPDHLSILTPVGSALLGLQVGGHIHWPTPDGTVRDLRVLQIHYQPEAAGDLHR